MKGNTILPAALLLVLGGVPAHLLLFFFHRALMLCGLQLVLCEGATWCCMRVLARARVYVCVCVCVCVRC